MMLSWCNDAIGANEAEDLLTASNPINCPTPFENTLLPACCGDNEGLNGHFGEFMQH